MQRVSKLAASLEVPEIVISKLEPWAAALILTQFALTKTGFDPTARHRHADHRARAHRWQAHRRTGDRHRPAERVRFDRSFEEQTRFLLDSADDVPKLNEDLQELIAAWRAGDLRALEKAFLKERAKSPELYDALLGARNRQWLPKIEALLKEDRDYLVVVGALHFVGRDGLLALLRSDGHKPVAVPAAKKSRRRTEATPMRAFAIFVGLIALGLAGIAILGYPAWLVISPWLDNPKFHRISSRVGMGLLIVGFFFVARRLKIGRPAKPGIRPALRTSSSPRWARRCSSARC